MIRNALDNGNFVHAVFIDLQKAFDTLNHDILLSKLNHYTIRSVAFDWFKSFLSNRIQYRTINNEITKLHNITWKYTTFLMMQISKTLTKKINFDLSNQVPWLRAIKIALYTGIVKRAEPCDILISRILWHNRINLEASSSEKLLSGNKNRFYQSNLDGQRKS